ncbi:DNA cytosine methyltransferase [Archangium gephyra]|uniref:DNA cytosine methyltransferase n=1 Tax=Archangium gephyra TaxID=48 RepID=UPI003B985E01
MLLDPRTCALENPLMLRHAPSTIDTPHLVESASSLSLEEVGRALTQCSGSAAQAAALELNVNWERARIAPSGPVDVIDMFSGCGGMSAGFLSVNGLVPAFRMVGSVDIDSIANRTYAQNIGIQPFNVDIGEMARRPKVFNETLGAARTDDTRPLVLIGCAPCQGFSSHRNEAGSADPRNSLFVDFARIATRLQPAAVIVENVPELLTDRYWPFVDRARELLVRAGYHVHVGVHNMAEFGVPQERFRALMLAMRRPFSPPKGFLSRSEFRTVRQAIGGLPAVRAGERHPDDPMHYTAGHKESTLATIRAVPKNGGNRPEDVGPECLRRAKARSGRAAYEDVYGRLFWDKPAITVTAYARNPASGRYTHPEQDRGLSVREAALLQSFPTNYNFEGSLDERFRQIGNAVPPAFAAYLAVHVLVELNAAQPPQRFDPGITAPVGPSFSRLIPALKAGYRKGAVDCDA